MNTTTEGCLQITRYIGWVFWFKVVCPEEAHSDDLESAPAGEMDRSSDGIAKLPTGMAWGGAE